MNGHGHGHGNANGNGAARRRFTPTVLFMCGGLLIWALDFVIVYVAAALVCAQQQAHATVLGIPVVTFIGIVASVLACAATAVIMWIAAQRLRNEPSAGASTRFINFIAIAVGAMALFAIVLNALPALLLAFDCSRA